MEVVRANGLEVAFERVGDGPPLAFVHGGAANGRVWRPQLASLADEFTVVAWDEPGAGRFSSLPADFGLPDYASCLAALIDALELGPAHVAGLSWGGRRLEILPAGKGGPTHGVFVKSVACAVSEERLDRPLHFLRSGVV